MSAVLQVSSTTPGAAMSAGSFGKRWVKSLLVLGVLAGVTAYGAHWWQTGRYLETTDDAYVGGDLTALSAKVPGYIAEVLVQDNQQVQAGDLLVKLDDREYRAALHEAEGAVEAQHALLNNLQATLELQNALIAKAQAALTAAGAETQRSRDDAQRYQQLSTTSAVSVQSWQRADTVHKQAIATEQAAAADLDAARRQVQVIETQQQQAHAALTQAKAARERAELDLSFTELRAPVSGTVGNRRAREGAYAAAGSQLLVVVPDQGLWIDANFKESQLAAMHAGQAVQVKADVLPNRIFQGRVASIAPATGSQFSVLPTENATGNFTKVVQRVPVRIQLDDADAMQSVLRAGLSVVVEVDTKS
jgi:membrane fusion protein (multidrug efflux system)